MRSFARKPISRLALAVAFTTGAAVGVTGMAVPAIAQKKNNKEQAPKRDYSKEFVAAYHPLSEQANSPTADFAAMRTSLPALEAAASTDDDKFAVANLTYTIGQRTKNMALQLRGLDMMISSGKVPAENLMQYNFQAGQLAYQVKDYPRSRAFIQKSLELGQRENDPEIIIAESYFAENNHVEGLNYLENVIKARNAAGQKTDEAWIKRGLSQAYNNDLKERARDFSIYYVSQYPSNSSWGDAIAIALNTGGYENASVLDLLRLSRRTGTFRDKNMYLEYIDAADPRKLPLEVQTLIDEGVASGLLSTSDAYLNEARGMASKRIAADRADLPSLENDARGGSAQLSTVMAAGNAFLSYGEGAKAEEFFSKAVDMPGADRNLVLTRLGIAQIDQGKFDMAEQTLAKIEGDRKPIAKLWAAYAAADGKTGAPAVSAVPAATAM